MIELVAVIGLGLLCGLWGALQLFAPAPDRGEGDGCVGACGCSGRPRNDACER